MCCAIHLPSSIQEWLTSEVHSNLGNTDYKYKLKFKFTWRDRAEI